MGTYGKMSKTVTQREKCMDWVLATDITQRKRQKVQYLFLGNAHVISNIGEDSGFNEKSLPSQALPSTFQSCAFSDATLNKLQDLVVLFLINLK